MSDMAVRMLAVDDHPVVAQGLLALAAIADPNLHSLGTATSYAGLREALDRLETPPDIVLMDLHLEDGTDPVDTIAELTDQGLRVVILTSELRPVPIRRAMQAGAVGLCLKSDEPAHILDVIRAAASGEFAVSSDLAFVLISDADLIAQLAPREVEALSLLADGVPRKVVGDRMDPPVAMSTVVTYLNRACERYRQMGREIATPRDAVKAAIQDGYLDA